MTQHGAMTPTHILVVRSLPLDATEIDLSNLFAHMDGVREARLIRERGTQISRGFGFVEFASVEVDYSIYHSIYLSIFLSFFLFFYIDLYSTLYLFNVVCCQTHLHRKKKRQQRPPR